MTNATSSTIPSSSHGPLAWVAVYSEACLSQKNPGIADVYQCVLRDFFLWLTECAGSSPFSFHQLTRTTVEIYLNTLEEIGYSVSHRVCMKSIISSFSQWLIDEYGLLKRNPARSLEIPAQQRLASRTLSGEQHIILRTAVEQADDMWGKALFALGYWAGCRVSDVAHLLLDHTHIGPKIGWMHVGHKGGKFRDIDLLSQARRPLYEYLQHGGRNPESPYIFTSQRNQQLTEAGIHHLFRVLKQQVNKDQWEKIADLSFHDLRHDFTHRAQGAGWTLEEIAYYLGHVTKKGTPQPSKRRQDILRSTANRSKKN